ncbi:uncharacterized protein L203_104641 [Cryptococcus depauperatus CBS 7841]|uniref:Uncharacterized protein n=1 Tax=Cryptococcus depauperatus CBS 7841 TaxID=1295531 RepID=A0A1E3ILX1_9TREE|nr:general transcription factor 3C polypeptide 3 (transcription factor C subunit 4) [Cryptococcus depauperatus CBS 7841]
MQRMAGNSAIPIDPVLLEEEQMGLSGQMQEVELSDDSHVDDDSDDEYQQSHLQEDQDVGEDKDEVFDFLAGFATEATPGAPLEGEVFQRVMKRADDEELPEPRRRGRPVNVKRRPHKPSHDVQHILGQANMAYLMEQHEEAIKHYLEVIRLDPYVPAAWKTLSSCYREMGNEEAARQMRFLGAHLDDESETWRDLAQDFRQLGQLDQAVYCLRKALKFELGEVDLLWELGSIYRIQGQKTRGSNVFRQMLAVEPSLANDFNFITTFHPLLLAIHQQSWIAQIGCEAFSYHCSTYATPSSPPNKANAPPPMKMEHIVTLLDDLIAIKDYENALSVVRRGQRWLQGRIEQNQWDTFEDDTEYDAPGTLRDGEESEGFPMNPNMRLRLALIRINLNDMEEANPHINLLLTLDPFEHQSLLTSLGDALALKEHWSRALDCYAAIQECDELPDDSKLIHKIGVCQWKLGDLDEALEALEWVANVDPENFEAKLKMASVLEDLGRKAEALDIITEIIRTRASRGTLSSTVQPNAKISRRTLEDQMKSQMHNLWLDVQDAERRTMQGEEGALDRFVESAGVLVENYRMDRSNFSKSRGIVRILKEKKHRNDIDDQAAEMQDRLERTLGLEEDAGNEYQVFRKTSFYGLSSEEWLAIVVKYCCVLMVRGEEDTAMDILEHVVWSGLFHNRRCEITIRLTIIACAMRVKAYEKITDSIRYLVIHSQFIPQPFLIMLGAISTGGLHAHTVFTETSLQNLMGRELRTYDEAVKHGEETLHFREGNGRWSHNKGRSKAEEATIAKNRPKFKRQKKKRRYTKRVRLMEENLETLDAEQDDGEGEEFQEGEGIGWGHRPVLPTKFSPYFNVLMGLEMLVSKSHQGAIFYLTKAHELDQWHPFICLLLAQAYFGRAMQRQSDNRNYQIAQGLIFLSRYRKLSPKTGPGREEVEYNFGRAFQAIGVSHLAVRHYETVLSSIERRMQEVTEPEILRKNSLAWEAAHNLMLLYAAAGNMKLLREKSRWLAI